MAVQPLNLPGYATPQSLDFTSLANLGQVYKQANQDATRQATLAQLGQGDKIDPRVLLASGDLSLANLGLQLQGQQASGAKDSRDFAFRQEEAKRAQANADRSYGLQSQAAARANEGPEAKAAQRTRLLQSQGIDPTTPEGRAYVISGEWSGAGAGGASLNPVYGVGPNGEPAMVQTTKTGQAIQTKLPDGFKISKDPIKVDLGTHIQLIDPQTRQPIGNPIQKDLAGAERAKVVGEAAGKSEASAPGDLQAGQNALSLLNNIKNDPYLDRSTGMTSRFNAIPGTGGYDFQNKVEQAKSGAFLTAIQQMRGLGALSNSEGQTATAAVTRMDTATSPKAFREALADYEKIIRQGVTRAQSNIKGSASNQNNAAADPLGIR